MSNEEKFSNTERLPLIAMGVWRGPDHNRRETCCFYHLFGSGAMAADADLLYLVLTDLPDAPGMSATNCVSLIAADFAGRMKTNRIRVFEQAGAGAVDNGDRSQIFDEFLISPNGGQNGSWRRLPAADAAVFNDWLPVLAAAAISGKK